MLKKFYIARHFWKAGKNATWEVSKKFPNALLEQIKSDYTILENERPKFIDYFQGTVFFVYNEDVDIYKRKIIEITASTCNMTIIQPDRMESIYSEIALVKSNIFEFNLSIDNSSLPDKRLETESVRKNYFKFLFWVGGLILILIVFFLSIGDHFFNSTKNEIQDQKKPQKSNEVKAIKTNSSEPETDIKGIKFCTEFREEILVKLCDDGMGWNNTVCICAYIDEQCSEPSKRTEFNKWSNENCLQNNFEMDEDYRVRIKKITKKSDRRKIEKFFKGK